MNVIGIVIRWLLVPVSAAAVVIGVVAAGRFGVSLTDARCAAENMIGGACVEPWHTSAVEMSIHAGMIIAALGVVIVPALVAPQLKRTVAVLGLVGLLSLAGSFQYVAPNWPIYFGPLAAGMLGGALGLWWVWSWRGRHEAE